MPRHLLLLLCTTRPLTLSLQRNLKGHFLKTDFEIHDYLGDWILNPREHPWRIYSLWAPIAFLRFYRTRILLWDHPLLSLLLWVATGHLYRLSHRLLTLLLLPRVRGSTVPQTLGSVTEESLGPLVKKKGVALWVITCWGVLTGTGGGWSRSPAVPRRAGFHSSSWWWDCRLRVASGTIQISWALFCFPWRICVKGWKYLWPLGCWSSSVFFASYIHLERVFVYF